MIRRTRAPVTAGAAGQEQGDSTGMSIFQDLQHQFNQGFLDKRQDVTSVTMAEADFDALCHELHLSKYERLKQVLNYTTGSMVQVICDPALRAGTRTLMWMEA